MNNSKRLINNLSYELLEIIDNNINNKSNKKIQINSEKLIKNLNIDNIFVEKKLNNINPIIFLNIFFIHLLCSFCFGFLIFIPLSIFYKKGTFKFLKALYLFNFSWKCIFINIFWIIFIIMIIIKIKGLIDFFEISYFVLLKIIVLFNISIKYSLIDNIDFKKLQDNNYDFNEFKQISFNYFNIYDLDQILKNIDKLYIENDIDKNNFYTSFFINWTEKEENELKINDNFFTINYNNSIEIKYYSCENIFNYLLRHFHQNIDKFIYLKFIILILILNYGIFFILNYNFKDRLYHNFFNISDLIIKNIYYFIIVLLIYLYIIYYLNRILIHFYINTNLLIQINNMININSKKNKMLPTIDFWDIYSIQNWVNLRKLANNFGNRLFIRYKLLIIIIFLLIVIQSFIIFIFSFRNIFLVIKNQYEKIKDFENFIIKDLIILYILFLKILYVLTKYNYIYNKDQNNLNYLLSKINYLKVIKSTYFEKYKNNKYNLINDMISEKIKNLNPEYFNWRCTKYLNKKFNDNLINESNNYLKNLYHYIKQQIDYFDIIKDRQCFKIFGITINKNLMLVILIGITPYFIEFILKFKIKK